MPFIVGFLIVFGSILTGYLEAGGKIGPLMQIAEFIIIGGSMFGAIVIGSGFGGVKSAVAGVMSLLKPKVYDKAKYRELMEMLYALFDLARREGILALEGHIDNPTNSEIFKRFPNIMANHHAVEFICDSLRMIVTGGIADNEIERIMIDDLDVVAEEELIPSSIFATAGDSLPGFGIVAAVLGIVITMQAINGPPEQIGFKVAAALVGTFLGILLAYGVCNPIAKALENQVKDAEAYMAVIRYSLDAFSRGYAAKICIEIARRHVPPRHRSSFEETEKFLSAKGTGG